MKIELDDTLSGRDLSKINSNFQEIENALNNNVLWRDNPEGEPNQMENLLDMNGERIINLPVPASPNDAARLQDVENAVAGIVPAASIPFSPTGTISSTNVQDAIAEVSGDVSAFSDVAQGDALIAVKTTVTGSQATTQHQVNDERNSIFQFLSPSQIAGVSSELGGGSAQVVPALQTALDSKGSLEFPIGRYMINTAQFIKSGTQRVSLYGHNRIRTILSPSVVDLSSAPTNVNTMFMVQDNNAHWCLDSLRFYSDVAYTGKGIYAVEGGGANGTGQALFSAVLSNLWIDLASNNTGFFQGAMQNSIVRTITAENIKGLFSIEGTGSADVSFTDIKAYNCFDPIISQTVDTFGSALMSVNDVHVYNHNRGRAIDVQNWVSSTIDGVIYEAAIGNLGQTGLFRFKDCQDLVVTNSMAMVRAGVALSSRGIDLTSSLGVTTRIKFKDIKLNSDIAVRLFGPGAFDISFEDCDFTDCVTAVVQIATACSGMIRTRGCRLNRCQGTIFLSTASNSLNWISDDDEFIDAGLGGGASSRNITLATSGDVVFNNPRIGRISVEAAAASFVEATGTGLVTFNNPTWIGVPPASYIIGSQFTAGNVIVNIQQPSGVQRVTAASATVFPATGTVIVDFAGTCTLTLPSVATSTGRELKIVTRQPQAVNSASAIVVPRVGGVAATGIVGAVDGAWVEMVCADNNWEIVQGS